MPTSIDGFYAAYLTGQAGTDIAMFAIRGEKIVGADLSGVQWDGSVAPASGGFNVAMSAKLPPDIQTIQGVTSGPSASTINYTFHLAEDFLNLPFVRIEGPTGSANARIVKVGELNL